MRLAFPRLALSLFRAGSHRPFAALLRGLWLLCGWLPLLCAAQNLSRDYDHTRSGYPLTGRHAAARCESCHQGGLLRGTPRDCESCHSSGRRLAQGNVVKPALHVPSTQGCESCHNTRSFSGARFSHAGVARGSCQGCHDGRLASGKHNGHMATTATCDSCHRSTRSWTAGVLFAHDAASAIGSGTCDGCHNGVAARGRSPGHIPVVGATARCDACHRSQTSFRVAMTMNHSVVSATGCKTCHNGRFTSQGPQGALGKPGNHIPEAALLNGAAMECNACHTSTASFAPMRMEHNNSLGNGAGSCKTCHQTGTNFLGNMERKALNHESRGAGVSDCSTSGCHRPLGRVGTSYRSWE